MDAISIVTGLVSIGSLVVSIRALVRANKTNENTERYRAEQLKMQDEQLRISRAAEAREAEALARAGEASLRSDVDADLTHDEKWRYQVVITALGPADSCNVNIVILGDDPLVPEGEIQHKLPARRLSAGKTVSLPASAGGLGPMTVEWEAILTWEDPDGSSHSKNVILRA